MYKKENISIFPYNTKALESLEYLRNYFNINIISPHTKKDIPSDLFIITTKPYLDEGLHKCINIRESGKQTPIFILSEEYNEYEAVLYFESGADDYCFLPIKKEKLLQESKQLYEGKQE